MINSTNRIKLPSDLRLNILDEIKRKLRTQEVDVCLHFAGLTKKSLTLV